MSQSIRDIRKAKSLTQAQAAELLNVSLRSYKSYETEESKEGTLKYNYMLDVLVRYKPVDETHGILTVKQITNMCIPIFEEYGISYCYLFGSYAKGTAKETSDVDLLVSSEVKGLKFFGLVEKLKNVLQKKVDVLDVMQLTDNSRLLNEILKDGVKIHG